MASVRETAPPPKVPELEFDQGYYDRLVELVRGLSEGAATGVLGAPVDLANMVLQPFGLGSERPVLGSEDIRQRLTDVGIYQPRSGKPAEAVGEFAGAMLAPGPDPMQWAALGLGMTKGAGKVGQLFDYSRLAETPKVIQENIARPNPPARGYPDYLLKVVDPKNLKRVRKVVERGLEMGGREWYNTEPLREAFVGELGEAAGNAAHRLFMESVAATSTRSKVLDNIRNASFYFQKMMGGQPLPLEPPLPAPYGHLAQLQHIKQIQDIARIGGIDPMRNPKPASFAENLRGNYAPVTVDAHNVRILGLTDASGRPVDLPEKSHYGFLEAMQQGQAKAMGLDPAQYQASAWLGGGAETGLKSEIEPFLRTFERVVERTAKSRGEDKVKTFRDFLKGKAPLLSVGPMTAMFYRSLLPEDMASGADDEDGT